MLTNCMGMLTGFSGGNRVRQENFERSNREIWDEYNRILFDIVKKKKSADNLRFPSLYRIICNHYAIAQSRKYSSSLVAHLHSMVIEGHKRLYRSRSFFLMAVVRFIVFEFPMMLRKYSLHFLLALMLFLLPALSSGAGAFFSSDFIYTVMAPQEVSQFEYIYDPSNRKTGRSAERSSDSDVMMFGFYIRNNISIGFRTFAGGILAGIGTIFFLVYNGIAIGAVSGHISGIGYGETFWQFVIGHGAFELTAIVISGTAGLILAEKIISPKNHTRADALKIAAPDALKLMMGAFAMLVIAAFIEAFWSSLRIEYFYKYISGSVAWLLVILYLLLAGRRRVQSDTLV